TPCRKIDWHRNPPLSLSSLGRKIRCEGTAGCLIHECSSSPSRGDQLLHFEGRHPNRLPPHGEGSGPCPSAWRLAKQLELYEPWGSAVRDVHDLHPGPPRSRPEWTVWRYLWYADRSRGP